MSLRLMPAALGLVLLIAPAYGQQRAAAPQPCRGVYLLGEAVPPACRHQARGSAAAVPQYRRWGDGYGATAPGAPDGRLPAEYGPRYFGGYNSLYGFGR